MNCRNTIQRDIIMKVIQRLNHPTAEELYNEIKKTYSNFSIATVYRNLKFLTKLGHINKITIGSTVDHYDINTDKHYHLLCNKCNQVSDVLIHYQKSLDKEVSTSNLIKVYDHQLIFNGLCKECLNN